MRVCLETEALYASEYPFVDYGCDLHIMAEMEKGVKLQKLTRTETDARPVQKKEVEEYLSNMRPKKFDKIPEAFSGKGPRGYILYDMAHHRTVRAP